MSAHQTRLDATQAIAERMRRGQSLEDAKAAVVKQADAVYKHSRPALYEGHKRVVRSVEFSDMPKDIMRRIGDDFLASIEKARGRKAGHIERWFYNLTGLTF